MTHFSLRPADLDDLEAVTDIHTAARTAYYEAGGWSDEELTSPEARASRRQAWRRAIERGDRTVLCAVRADGEVTGVLGMGPPYEDDIDPSTTGQLYQIHVRPGSWGEGIGSLLHGGFVSFLREHSLTTGVLEAWERNSRAHAFYARHGWRPDGHSRPGPCQADYVRLRLESGPSLRSPRVTEPAYLTAIRESYDTVADAYAEQVPRPTALDPVSRALLGVFAETVRNARLGPVADVGCGPGHVTAYLADLGVPVLGIDLSPRMLELARRSYPELTFREGSMTALDIEDGSLGGILAYFSTHHTPLAHLPLVYAEFARVLAPGGCLMLAGHVGAEDLRRPTRAYGGLPVSYETHLLPLERLAGLLEEAGLVVTARVAQEPPKSDGTRSFGTLLARRPAGGDG